MADSDAVFAFDQMFGDSPPGEFLKPVYSPSTPAMTTDNLSITQHFVLLGTGDIAIDFETALAPDCFKGWSYLRCVALCSPNHRVFFDFKKFNEAERLEFKENCERSGITFIAHNWGFDGRILKDVVRANLKNPGVCTMIKSWLVSNGQKKLEGHQSNISLAATVERELGVKLEKDLQAQDWMNKKLEEQDIEYCMRDAQFALELNKILSQKIFEQSLSQVYEIEHKVIGPTNEMESSGLHLNRDKIDQLLKDFIAERDTSLKAFIEELESELPDDFKLPKHDDGSINLNKKTEGNLLQGTKIYAGFNSSSSPQLLARFNAIGINPVDRYGKPTVNKDVLAKWNHHPVIIPYLSWKKADKAVQMCKTLVKAQNPDDQRIYARFNQTGTFTGRYSSSGPNLQNVPRGAMRYAFDVLETRALCSVDVAGMEMRAACSKAIADEPAMRAAFNEGRDVHYATAASMFNIPLEDVTKEQRRIAKSTGFAMLFGSSADGLVNYFSANGVTISLKEGEQFRSAWLKTYPQIAKWHKHCRAMVDACEPVRMVDGRRRYLTGEAKRHTIFANNTVQGSCASVMKLAMYGIHIELRNIDLTARMVGQIHDELLIECDETKAPQVLELAKSMISRAGHEIFGDDIEMVAEGSSGKSWGEAH